MTNVSYNEKDSIATLKFDQSLTVQNITEIKNALTNVITKADKLIIEHNSVKDFDVSYLQLLIAVQNSMETSGKKLIIDISKNNVFRDFLEESGCMNLQFLFEEADEKLEIR
jgi:MFS superfamily sulfate permease-like transporter